MSDLFVPADTVIEMLKSTTEDLPFSSRKVNTFFIMDDNVVDEKFMIKDKYDRYHIRHNTADIIPVFKSAMKARRLFIVEPFSKYNIVIRGSDTILDVITNNQIFLEKNQISQLQIPYEQLTYIITKIELPNNLEKSFLVSSAIASELKNTTDWVYDNAINKKVKTLLSI